jgi:transketolase C-terminal domain/subunit
VRRHQKVYEQQIPAVLRKLPESKPIKTLPGLGKRLVPELVAVLGPRQSHRRFDSARALSNLAGCRPITRVMPGMTVLDPCDAVELYQATKAIAEFDGPVYMRLQRGDVPVFFDESSFKFELGRAKLLNSVGEDLLIISLGLMTRHAFEAVLALEKEGIKATLVHVSTLKPFDSELILEQIDRIRLVVTCENHTIIGGLGSLVAETAASNGVPITLRMVGVHDLYATCGSTAYLFRKYGLDSTAIVERSKEALKAGKKFAS